MTQFIIAPNGIPAAKDKVFVSPDPTLEQRQIDASDGFSYLGTRVYDELVIQGGQYYEQIDVEQANPIPFEGLKMHTVLLEVNQGRNVVTTALQGRNGTVKEFVADGDFAITITGKLVGENQGDLVDDAGNSTIVDIGNFFPLFDTQRLAIICKVPDAITLTSDFLTIFGISECVIMNYFFGQKEATRNEQPFQINLLSDSEIILNELEI